MTDESKFQDLLDRFGSDPTTWPDRERAWAQQLLSRSDAAQKQLARAEAFDRDLLNAVPDARSALIRQAVLDALPPHRLAGGPSADPRGFWWRWLAGASVAAASLVLSFYIGTTAADIWPSAGGSDDSGAYAEFDSMLFGIGFDGGLT